MSRRNADLWVACAAAAAACAAAALRMPAGVTAVPGLALFAAPGYLLGQVLAGPGRPALERLAVSAGLALCVPVIGGLLLYLARLPLDRASWLGLLAGVTVAAAVLVFLRRRRSQQEAGGPRPPRWRLRPGPSVAFGLAVLIAAGAVGLARVGAAEQHYPGFTQLWLVRPHAGASTVSLGVSNDEGATTRYQLVLLRNGKVTDRWNLTLRNGQVWRRTPPYTANIAAHLYRLPDFARPYREVGAGNVRDRKLPR
jgi:hypothetical protein